jgi:hypothetical protein
MLARAETPAWDATMKRLIAHSATERADATAAPLLPAPSSPVAPHPSDDDDRAALASARSAARLTISATPSLT